MQSEDLIPASEFCIHYNTEFTFVQSLHQFGLIEITTIESTAFIQTSQLHELEKFVRFHDEMGINLEGIEAIHNILQRTNDLQHEINRLKNRLQMYEPGD
jgi:hypothetical protein